MSNKIEFLCEYVVRQIANYFPDYFNVKDAIVRNIPVALQQTEQCISSIIAWGDREFNYLISRHYATFLYFLGNCIWRESGRSDVSTRIFLLNKSLNGIDLFFEIEMPRHFAIGHSVGMVFAKATYGDYCVFHQGCTVGRNWLDRPVLENGIIMFPGSMIIGNCLVRENSVITPGVTLINTDTPGNCYVFQGKNGRPFFKELGQYFADKYFIRSDYSESAVYDPKLL